MKSKCVLCIHYKKCLGDDTCKQCFWTGDRPNFKPKQEKNMQDNGTIREFETGATRDTAGEKLNYVKGLSAIVLHRYMQYLAKHRKQSDGSTREFDNWKNGIPDECYVDSLVRHSVNVWRVFEGVEVQDNHGPVTEEDLLCAIIFNAHGKLFELLKNGRSQKKWKST